MQITEKINIYNIDCMEFMKDVSDKFYDLAIVDPPYGIGNFTPESDSGLYKKGTKKIKVNYDLNYNWNNYTPDNNYFDELYRISKRQIIWGANYYNKFSKLGGALIWYKNIGLVSQLSQCEIASLSWKKQIDYIHLKKQTGFIKSIEYIHPCEKPIKLYEWILTNYAKQGWKIFDSHFGSLSIGIACHNLGFQLDACELDKHYFNDAKKRLEIHINQLINPMWL